MCRGRTAPAGQLVGLRATATYPAWRGRAVAEARAALGDERYDSLADEGGAIPWHDFLADTIAHLDAFLNEPTKAPAPELKP